MCTWRVSPYDGQLHGFATIDEQTSAALCDHSVPSAMLGPAVALTDKGGYRHCLPCLLIHGNMLADHTDDRDRYTT